jgi:biotin carboxyl carrier protein
MKMENAVVAPWPGTIARVGVVAGQTVERGDELVVIE